MSSPFDFLAAEFPELHSGAGKSWIMAMQEPRTSCFHARWTIEQAIKWAYTHDRALSQPYEHTVSAMLNEPAFKNLAGERVYAMAREAIRLGNRAAHESRPMTAQDSITAVSHLFQFCYWFARTYAVAKPAPGLSFDPRAIPRPKAKPAASAEDVQALARALAEEQETHRIAVERLEATSAAAKAALEAELAELKAQVAAAKVAASATPDTHDYSEAETRTFLIDLLLHEAGWDLTEARDREFEVTGMPFGTGLGYVDYVLWGTDGKPLALVEAKRTTKSPQDGQQQAKIYADRLAAAFGQRPVIFYTNGYDHWLWDDEFDPPREVAGFYTRAELELAIQRRTERSPLGSAPISSEIVERYYQRRAITRIAETFEAQHQRKALLVMATGAGKTRTVVALADLLIRANWAKRILFLADRTALVSQAANVFKAFLPDSPPVNLVTDHQGEGRIFVSTYPTMLNLINTIGKDGRRRFGPGHFDLVVIDEAHRSVFAKYRAIFDHFDTRLVGLTATPKDEVDRNTYGLFGLEDGVPTDNYGIDEAVADGFLVPPKAMSVPLKFLRQGITYDELPEDEKLEWEEMEWSNDGLTLASVEASALNKWLFNADTVDKVLGHLMTHGQKVAGGDRLGKTIVFAASQAHAEFIAARFNAQYPHYKGDFARVITHSVSYAQDLIDKFSIPESDPQIAISVDMLDTGIDVPEVLNLLFFKQVRSKTKFWQMIGRGTRLRPDLFAPGENKAYFTVFDVCQNFEYFNQNPDSAPGTSSPSLASRLFCSRLDLLTTLDGAGTHASERASIAELLRVEVAAMNPQNVVVAPHRELVDRFAEDKAWDALDVGVVTELARSVAGLPSALGPEPEPTKRFDLLMLQVQLAHLKGERRLAKLAEQVRGIAEHLEDYLGVPAVAAQALFIADVQNDEWWVDVTLPMLEDLRKRLRTLIPFIQKAKQKILYTDFEDTIGEATEIDLSGIVDTFEKFRRKTRHFLREHLSQAAVGKLYGNQPIGVADLDELKGVLLSAGLGTPDDIERAEAETGGFGLFVRSLVGLDRAAAKTALSDFLDASKFSADQIEFATMVVDHLVDHGLIEVARFYESPFTDVSPHGPDALFEATHVDLLLAAVHDVRRNAEAA